MSVFSKSGRRLLSTQTGTRPDCAAPNHSAPLSMQPLQGASLRVSHAGANSEHYTTLRLTPP
ncbi:hypothetical protein APX70_200559 [Pseudomonas syringae pv. maculicola]|uniref:Uncharacterized protein n=1 Tax=Pseudomonas syringae pv. maculicola TaxID=59511 RepID=A0A3M2YF48_PSEYM|nr:hypothetical protein APX70_200559 [Pseudomonas syringae pv. maculicola]